MYRQNAAHNVILMFFPLTIPAYSPYVQRY